MGCYRYIAVIIAWILFVWAAYKVAQIKTDHVEYDPYEVLGVDRVSVFLPQVASKADVHRCYIILAAFDFGNFPGKIRFRLNLCISCHYRKFWWHCRVRRVHKSVNNTATSASFIIPIRAVEMRRCS